MNKASAVFIFFSTAAFGFFQVAQYILMPKLATLFHWPLADVIFLYGVSSLGFILMGLFWSRVQRPSITLGLLGLTLSEVLLIIGEHPGFLIASRVSYALLVSSLLPSALTFFKSSTAPVIRYSQALSLGRLLAPVVLLFVASAETVLAVAGLLNIIIIGCSHHALTVSPLTRTETGDSGFNQLILISLCAAAYLGILQSSLGAIVTSRIGFTDALTTKALSSLFLLSATITLCVHSLPKIWSRIPSTVFLTVGATLSGVGGLLLIWSSTLGALKASVIVASTGLAFVHPSLNHLYLKKPSIKGVGLLSSTHGIGHAGGTFLLGALGPQHLPSLVLILCSVFVVLSFKEAFHVA